MQRNEALEAYQKEAYDQHIATYTFSVAAAGVTSDEQVKLNSIKPGINLHFLRYGVFSPRWYYKTSFIDVSSPEDERPFEPFEEENDPEVVNPKDPIELNEVFITADRVYPAPSDKASKLSSAQYRITGINQGYIYILEENNENFWLEFAVDNIGNLHPILWENNIDEKGNYKDVRGEISNETLSSYTIEEGTKIWITLSLSQLSIKQLEEYSENPDNFDRLQSIVCNPIEKSSDLTDRKKEGFRSFREFIASFSVYEETNARLLQSKLDQIAKLEYPENRDEEDTTFEDLFILLEDPVQCANDLSIVIDGELAWLKALTDTLKTGKSAYDVYDKLMKLPVNNDSTIEVPPEEKEEIQYIFALALATYKFIYDNEELKDDFSRKHGEWYLSHGIDDQKLDKILAITQRKNQRNLINKLRDDLGNFLKSDYYNIALNDFKEGSYPMIESGKDIIADHLGALSVHPTMVDRHLLLASQYNPYEDTWIKQIRKTITSNSDFTIINELLDIRIPIVEVEQVDSKANIYVAKFGKKFLSHFGKMTKAYIGVGSLSRAEIKLVDTKVQYLTKISKAGKQGPFIKMDKKDFFNTLKKEKTNTKSYKYKNSNYNHFTKKYAFLKIHEEVVAESKNIARRTGKGKSASIFVQGVDQKPYAKQLEKMVMSPEYKSAVLVFEIWALITSIEKIREKGLGWENGISMTGALVKTTAASLKLMEEFDKITGVQRTKLFGDTVKVFSIVGSGFTVFSATKDMVKSINASDNDAALAYSVAAGISGYLLAVELGLLALSTGPFIVVAGIGMLAYGLAYYLTDGDLEKFFKHYPFSTQMTHATTSDNPFLYARAMYEQRDELIKRWEGKYMDKDSVTYKHLFVRLTNLLAGGLLKIKGSSESSSKNDRGSYLSKKGSDDYLNPNSGFWTSMDIRISFASFLQHQKQIEYEVYLIQSPELFKEQVSYRISNRNIKSFMIKQENNTQQLQLWLQLPKAIKITKKMKQEPLSNSPVMVRRRERKISQTVYLQADAKIAVLCKFKGNSETIFPLTINNTHGYLYTAMPAELSYNEGVLITRSFDAMIVTKQAFLNAYPLQNPE